MCSDRPCAKVVDRDGVEIGEKAVLGFADARSTNFLMTLEEVPIPPARGRSKRTPCDFTDRDVAPFPPATDGLRGLASMDH
jgi:hypothetical protein